MVTTRDPIGRFAPEFHSDPGGDILTYESESELSEREREALTKLTTLVAGVTGSTSAQAESSIAQIRQEYLRLAETG